MTSGRIWYPQHWHRNLEIAQIVTQKRFEELKEKLETYSEAGTDPRIRTCCETLDQLEGTVRRASWYGQWKTDPVELAQTVIDQVLAFQKSELDPFLLILELLKINLEALVEHSRSPS
jgi:hypothetical protein